ncbi:hypothetical protein CK203_099373 [Vitis vinifera]|uniref:Uncharacterized protein n=1 Tax=Vitis vinifera TaxID=29760 RepID=A0A438CHP8_VITVI|nr:hypothetical protein CK203_099373 [Vitis vinifera]
MPQEAIIKRPMVTVPPIESNSHCRARPFHSSYILTSRSCDSSRSFEIHLDYSRGARSPTAIHFSIDRR